MSKNNFGFIFIKSTKKPAHLFFFAYKQHVLVHVPVGENFSLGNFLAIIVGVERVVPRSFN